MIINYLSKTAYQCFRSVLQPLNATSPNPQMAQTIHDLRYAICSYNEIKARKHLTYLFASESRDNMCSCKYNFYLNPSYFFSLTPLRRKKMWESNRITWRPERFKVAFCNVKVNNILKPHADARWERDTRFSVNCKMRHLSEVLRIYKS